MEQEWERKCEMWAIRKGFLHGVAANMREALDKNWYSQLKHLHTTYRNVQPIQILNHLNTQWCPLDMHAKKIIKAEYWTKWDGDMHLTAFVNDLMMNKSKSNASESQSQTKINCSSTSNKCMPAITLIIPR